MNDFSFIGVGYENAEPYILNRKTNKYFDGVVQAFDTGNLTVTISPIKYISIELVQWNCIFNDDSDLVPVQNYYADVTCNLNIYGELHTLTNTEIWQGGTAYDNLSVHFRTGYQVPQQIYPNLVYTQPAGIQWRMMGNVNAVPPNNYYVVTNFVMWGHFWV